MNQLFENLLEKSFTSSQSAIEFCREFCSDYGFNIRQETSNANQNNTYVYCDGIKQDSPSRKRPSECPWRLLLSQNELSVWHFYVDQSEHNHPIKSQDDWPKEVYERIQQLIHMKTEEIRDSIKLQFPDIIWNDRRFSNYLSKIRQKSMIDRVQRLVMASTRLCSVVAANEDWSNCVENDLIKLLDSYGRLSKISPQQLESMVDLELDMIHSEIDKVRTVKRQDASIKKRKSVTQDDTYMSIPSCNLYVRSQPLRSLSDPSQNTRRCVDPTTNNIYPQMTPFVFNSLTSPVSSPSSTSSIQQHYSNELGIPDSNMIIPPNYNNSNSHHLHHSTNYYPPYYPPSMTNDMNFTFDSNTTHFQPMMLHRSQTVPTTSNMNYSSSIQQRLMQDYEQRQQQQSIPVTNQLQHNFSPSQNW